MSVQSFLNYDPASAHRLNNLLMQTGYKMVQNNGQRILSVPPYLGGLVPEQPEHGSEIFVGKLPRDLYEDEIVPVFSMAGRIFNIRLMLDFSGFNRGYCFISYFTREEAKRAIQTFHGFEIRPRNFIGVYMSIDNCRLFIGGIVPQKTREEVFIQLSQMVEGVVDVIMYKAYYNPDHNRGYVFVEFDSHRHAAMARRKFIPGSTLLFGHPVIVDWADPIPDVDPSIMSKVTKLYIRNLDVTLPQENLEEILMSFIPISSIARVYKMNDYAFVHFTSRVEAEKALYLLNGAIIAGTRVEAMWARPRIYSKSNRLHCFPENFCTSIPPKMRKQMKSRSIKSSETANSNEDASSSRSSSRCRNCSV